MAKCFAIDLKTLGIHKSMSSSMHSSEFDTALFIVCHAIEDLGYEIIEFSNHRPLTAEEHIKKNRIVSVLETLTLGIPSDVIVKVKVSLTQIGVTFLY